MTVEQLRAELTEMKRQLEQVLATANALKGAIQMLEKLQEVANGNGTNRPTA